jgi:hypothetical protein
VENAARTLDFTPAGVLAGGGDAVVGLEAAIATLRAIYKPGSPKAEAAGLQIVIGFDDALQFAIQASAPIRKRLVGEVVAHDAAWWARWLAGARDASHAVCDAYWCLSPSQSTAGPEPVRHRLAVSVVEALKWSACDRFSPDETLWARISQLFANSAEFSDSVIGGDRPGIGREYLRAVAYYSANLDQAELNMAIALVHLIDLSLPFLELTRKAGMCRSTPFIQAADRSRFGGRASATRASGISRLGLQTICWPISRFILRQGAFPGRSAPCLRTNCDPRSSTCDLSGRCIRPFGRGGAFLRTPA